MATRNKLTGHPSSVIFLNLSIILLKLVLRLNAKSVTFNSISGSYTDLVISMISRSSGGTATVYDEIYVTFNNDTTANYESNLRYFQSTVTGGGGTSGATSILAGYLPGSSRIANFPGVAYFRIPYYSNTTFSKIMFSDNPTTDGSSYSTASVLHYMNPGLWRSTSAITRVDITCGVDNFIAGSIFTLWGVT
jgi:hypothetical protein